MRGTARTRPMRNGCGNSGDIHNEGKCNAASGESHQSLAALHSEHFMSTPLATHDYTPGHLGAALEFLKRTRWELRQLRKVHVYQDRVRIIDVNGDSFEVRGVGYPDADVAPMLRAVNTGFDP